MRLEGQFVIERAGKPMAAIVPLWQLEEWQKLRGREKSAPDTIKESKRLSKKGSVSKVEMD